MIRDVLIYDLETDSLHTEEAKIKFFGAYSYIDSKYYIYFGQEKKEIQALLDRHKILVSFNGKSFDNPILTNNGFEIENKYKVFIDLYEVSAGRGTGGYGQYNKNRLVQMGVEIKTFTLKNIINVLKLDTESKGEIDYKIFQKDEWTKSELDEIKKYLKQDIDLTKKLFEWYEAQFQPIKGFMSTKSQRTYKHITSGLASVAYEIICNKAGLKPEYGERPQGEIRQSFEGAHHINPRQEKVTGNIVNIDFTAAYPHSIIMGNLHTKSEEGWNGDGYFNLKGIHNSKEQGKIELALKEILLERLKAKQSGDKIKATAYKLISNSSYGLFGNPIFKSLYNPVAASDCTSMIRTCLKKLAKTIEEDGFEVLYGFTDNIIVRIPPESSKEELMYIVDKFIQEVKSHVPWPMESFKMELESEMKFIWFVAKNCYLYVTSKDEVKYKSTLLNTNTPKVVMQVFNDYMKPKIIKELDINFTETELTEQIRLKLKDDVSLAAEEFKVGECSDYKSQTSIQYQISEMYGAGKHYLIQQDSSIGMGKDKGTKKRKAMKYCTIEEFKANNLNIENINLDKLLQHLKSFLKYEPTLENKQIQDFEKKMEVESAG